MKRFIKLLGVSALVLTTAFAPFTIVQSAFAASGQAVSSTDAAVMNDPFSYVVQPGDYLSSIAQEYGTSVAAILALNPQITNPSLIYSGEVLQIPVGSVSVPVIPLTGLSVVVTPEVSMPGSRIQVSVNSFPAKTPIMVSVHPLHSTQVEVNKEAITNANGKVVVSLKIPSSLGVNLNQAWVAQVRTTKGTSLSVNSNQFIVGVGATTYPTYTNGMSTYVVRSGDYLALIAREYGTSVAAIMALNPQLNGSYYIYPGEVLAIPYGYTNVPYAPIIPLTGPVAVISPNSGPQGTVVQVVLSGFPAYTSVEVGLHKLNHRLIERTADATTDAYGATSVIMRIPTGSNINNNRIWQAQVNTTSGTSITVASNPFYVTGN
jgi:LysM repeat protein